MTHLFELTFGFTPRLLPWHRIALRTSCCLTLPLGLSAAILALSSYPDSEVVVAWQSWTLFAALICLFSIAAWSVLRANYRLSLISNAASRQLSSKNLIEIENLNESRVLMSDTKFKAAQEALICGTATPEGVVLMYGTILLIGLLLLLPAAMSSPGSTLPAAAASVTYVVRVALSRIRAILAHRLWARRCGMNLPLTKYEPTLAAHLLADN